MVQNPPDYEIEQVENTLFTPGVTQDDIEFDRYKNLSVGDIAILPSTVTNQLNEQNIQNPDMMESFKSNPDNNIH